MSGIKTISFALFVMLVIIQSASAEVNLALTTGEVRYFAEDIFMLKLDLAINEDSGFYGDVYLVVVDPNGTIYFAPEWQQSPKPVLENFFFPPTVDLKSALIIEQGIPNLSFPMTDKGEYIFAIGIAKPKTFDFIKIASVTTEYLGEREWEVIDLELSKTSSYPSIIIDDYISDGGYWIGFSICNLQLHYKDGILKEYDADDGLVDKNQYYAQLYSDYVYDYQGDLWIATWSGLFKYQPESNNFVNYIPFEYSNENWLSGAFNSIANYLPGSFWVASSDGLWLFESQNEKWTYYSKEDFGLESGYVNELVMDTDRNLWFAIKASAYADNGSGGVVKYDGKEFTTFSAYNTFNGRADFSFIELDSEGCIWVGSPDGGLYRYVDGEWIEYTTEDGLSTTATNCIFVDSFGKVWIGPTGQPPAQFKDGSFITVVPELMDLGMKSIIKIYQDSKNNYWFIGITTYSFASYNQKLFKWGK